ncbi:MAG: M1 family metallopeptidase [Flavihumibacter sp.]|nr:M1 family metallopeptidase [Flavihumibacter sp.]
MQQRLLTLLAFIIPGLLPAQAINTRADIVDVQHYRFQLLLNDANDTIKGNATISILFLKNTNVVELDLYKKNESGKGMLVTAVTENNNTVKFSQQEEILRIATFAKAGETIQYTIHYHGVPANGLIIDKNKYGQRTFFADNWPNRAHHWLPCIDHPADKAAVEFMVTAPQHYQVVANGVQVEETNSDDGFNTTYWKETVALPTKVMAIGVANFAVQYAGAVDCIPVYSWVYPKDKEKGFYDYAPAKEILSWFIKTIGPYAYLKLANVQSKTRFGGMENASVIFYAEDKISGTRDEEALLAHEIAHQWFGNSATEINWQHIWLSEGSATYLTHLYLEATKGTETLQQGLQKDRSTVVAFSKTNNKPVIDLSVQNNFTQLLNANSYQKGSWVLHMLRRKLGDDNFSKGLKNYYQQYAGKNASTEDFRKVMETTSGQDLQSFFTQWLYTPGQPQLRWSWQYHADKKTVSITVDQQQAHLFQFPLQVLVQSGNDVTTKSSNITAAQTIITIPAESKPNQVVLDPNTNLLFEEIKQ